MPEAPGRLRQPGSCVITDYKVHSVWIDDAIHDPLLAGGPTRDAIIARRAAGDPARHRHSGETGDRRAETGGRGARSAMRKRGWSAMVPTPRPTTRRRTAICRRPIDRG